MNTDKKALKMTDGWRHIRVASFFVLATGLIGIVASCQEGKKSATVVAVGAQTQPSVSAEMEAARRMGFSFAMAPAKKRADAEVAAGSAACVACHAQTDAHTMHKDNQGISCADCHGGHPDVPAPMNIAANHPDYERLKLAAHVKPRLKDFWKSAANPQIPAARTLQESADYIRFVNPGDLRAARAACASCHEDQVRKVEKSMMAHGGMLWDAALYNNGAINRKNAVYGESYAIDGTPQKIVNNPPPTAQQFMERGILPALWPLPRWEITQPGNILRVFERGGRRRPVLGVPDPEEDPGRPEVKLSVRGLGTDVRTDPVFIGLQKTRLLDPTLNLFGTNDHPGDYRASGCSACHVVYANDRDPVHSAIWAKYGNRGQSFSKDLSINPTTKPSHESGHPIQHQFTRYMPTSTCIVCHVHPGTSVMNSYLGTIWWDNESDGEFMYPKKQRYPTADQEFAVSQHNPESAAARGLWSNLYPNEESHAGVKAGPDFLEKTSELNDKLKHVQFADFHGHGWVFRKVYKQDRHGNMLDASDKPVASDDPDRFKKAVHLKDIHLEKGMHCADCHFSQDSHGDGNLYGETRNPVMVDCADCHGTAEQNSGILRYLTAAEGAEKENLFRNAFSGNAGKNPTDKQLEERKRLLDPDLGGRFEARDNRLFQKSKMYEEAFEAAKKQRADLTEEKFKAESKMVDGWVVVQTRETVIADSAWATDAAIPEVNRTRARYAHAIRKDNKTWEKPPEEKEKGAMALAHGSKTMSCYACHTSWNTSCFGCHLPMRANQRKDMQHNEGAVTRNYTNYNFQTLRDDVYMLGVDSTVRGHKIVPVRSACAVMVSSQDANRQWIYTQQQTVSAEGYAGTAFSPYFPHTVRAAETKQCTDCHLSKDRDNNAIMAQLLMQGTNAVNFIGRFAWVAEGNGGLEAVAVTERDEPQAVIGSRLHELAYPDFFNQHVKSGSKLKEAYAHEGHVLDVQLRGEYLYAACAEDGFIAYDVANIDNKGFSERIISAPVSPLGQRFYVKTKYATSVCSPSTLALDPWRQIDPAHPQRPENEEGKITRIGEPETVLEKNRKIHLIYAFLYVTDREEGLVVIGNPLNDKRNKPGVSTLLDGDPDNNFLQRAATYNPSGLLRGARHMAIYGTYAYICCDAGVVVLDMDNPLSPRHVATLSDFKNPRRVAMQFRYGFVCDDDGVKVINVTFPDKPQVVAGAVAKIADARDIYISRTYGYVAAGKSGLVIVDLEQPEKPSIAQSFTADGQISDATAVRVGMTNSSMFAYVADGSGGLKVIQLTSPDDTPGYLGFSPRPTPRLIAWYKTHGPAVSLSEGLDRDRAVDESGNQLAVFGRRGARPFTLEEQRKLYLRLEDRKLVPYYVGNEPK
jgi:hypothetical protein